MHYNSLELHNEINEIHKITSQTIRKYLFIERNKLTILEANI